MKNTKTMTDFIQTFADIKTGKQSEWNPFSFDLVDNKEEAVIKELTSFLETNIIKGKIKEKRNEQNYKSYFLGVNNKEIDLHLASSATLETLPFIVFISFICITFNFGGVPFAGIGLGAIVGIILNLLLPKAL